MNNQTIRELRAIAKERGLKGCYKLRKAELVSLLETSPMGPEPEKSLGGVTLLLKPEDMDSFELQGMAKTISAVKSELNEWCGFVEERMGVLDAAKVQMHLVELFFEAGRSVGRSQSGDAPVGDVDDCAG